MRTILPAAIWLAAASFAGDAPVRFESHVQPLLKTKCLACHGEQVRQGGLSLASRDEILRGGKTGAAAVPGKPSDSLLLSVVNSGAMPMGGARLSRAEIDLLRHWIEGGALREGESEAPKLVSEKEIFSSILGAKCFVCHGRRTRQAGLDLRTREALLKGGKSGPAILPGRPEESLIVKRIAAQEMPPAKLQEQFSVRGLTDDEFEKLKAWIAAGAPADNEKPLAVRPEADPLVSGKDRQHWAFRPPVRPAVPSNGRDNPIDAFLLARLQEKGLAFSRRAAPATLLRRAYIDLIGMPPSPEQVREFLADPDPDAFEKVVDRLLASPRYGERWSRYWLDAAGYADSEGAVSADSVRPHAWRYRDYVIRALNGDKPYDQFLTEQIAGDETFDYQAVEQYTAEQIERLAATGFLRMAPDSTYSTEQNFMPERFDTIAAQIEVLSSSVMGLTIGCARCHDHKYDPIPQRDYYRLSAILQTAYDPYDWRSPNNCLGVGAKCGDAEIRLLPLRVPEEQRANEAYNAPIRKRIEELEQALAARAAPIREKLRAEKLAKLSAGVRDDLRTALDTPADNRTEIQKYLVEKFGAMAQVADRELAGQSADYAAAARETQLKIRAERQKLRPASRIRALFDMGGEPTPNRILLRGEFTNPGPLVEPGPPSVLSDPAAPYQLVRPNHRSGTSGRRLALADWLTRSENPLTARVMVNRVWQHHFGTGLVAAAGNFGRTASPPTHPELLDWLATEFVQQGWSIKAMHRLIMTSSAYRQSSQIDESRAKADPENRLVSRFPLRRKDADALYDSILAVSGLLDETPFGPPVELKVAADGEVSATREKSGYRRAIYLQQRRSRPVSALETFDAPLLNPNCVRRSQSTVSLQALQLMNSDLVRESARHMAGRIIDAVGEDAAGQVNRVYLSALSRPPEAAEQARAVQTLEKMRLAWERQLAAEKPAEPIRLKSQWLALASLCHTVLNSAEFLYVD